jgi:nicotinate-nucleotide adenylyltransferase
MGLDQLWWLVSPANPLKQAQPQPMAQRINAARAMARAHPKIVVSDIEQHLGTRYTADTLAHLGRLYPRTNFVWIMGADNLAQFHRWKDWQQIMAHMPVAVFARPGERMAALTSRAAKTYANHRCDIRALAQANAPAWGFANMPMRADSSSALRATGKWGAA